MAGEAGLSQLVRSSVSSITTFSLTPIPLFILMGEVLFHPGLAVKVIDGIERVIRHVPGRLAVVAVVAGTVFSAISGSTIATTGDARQPDGADHVVEGLSSYDGDGPIMAIGAVDMLIPPSALAVLLGSLSGISISKLLIGGMPGIILSSSLRGLDCPAHIVQPELAPIALSRNTADGQGSVRRSLCGAIGFDFRVVVGAMVAGWATPTESAAIGAFATIVLAGVYRALTPKVLWQALHGTVLISGMILFIIIGATTFSQILSFSGSTNGIVNIITQSGLSANALVIVMLLILIVLGVFIDQVSMMLITLPIFMPLVNSLAIDPVWFGVLFLICMQLGMLLPPHGLLLMTMKGVTPPQVTMGHIFQAVVPYLVISIAVLALVYFVPEVATWMPKALDY